MSMKAAVTHLSAAWLSSGCGVILSSVRKLPVRGDRNAPLYRLVEFSRHPLPNKIWDDVAKPVNLDLFPDAP